MKKLLLFIGFFTLQNCKPQSNTTKMETCLNQNNFDKAYNYILWKYQTAKRLSKNRKVMFGNGYELDVINQSNIGKRIVFSKDGYKGFSVDMKEGFIPHTKIADNAKYDEVFCELIQQASFHNGIYSSFIAFNFVHPNAGHFENLLNKYKESFIKIDAEDPKDEYQNLLSQFIVLEGKESKLEVKLIFFKTEAGKAKYYEEVFIPQKHLFNVMQKDGRIRSVGTNGSVIFEVIGTDKWRVNDLISYLSGEE